MKTTYNVSNTPEGWKIETEEEGYLRNKDGSINQHDYKLSHLAIFHKLAKEFITEGTPLAYNLEAFIERKERKYMACLERRSRNETDN